MSFLDIIPRSSHWRCSLKKGALKNFANSSEKQLCWSLFLIKLRSFVPETLSKRDSNKCVFLRNQQTTASVFLFLTS